MSFGPNDPSRNTVSPFRFFEPEKGRGDVDDLIEEVRGLTKQVKFLLGGQSSTILTGRAVLDEYKKLTEVTK
jgi:hypothetical protein